ncbi:hypothetical protein SCHPADRAFT_900092 [Schizopora paradoxa]|uniref:Uncharacterized protein n=1 Tax=Schizopora paradoxa TaxID=27342 RepID=A0A0H2SM07_9AGAM|nr:hypothetical protein SCHPADRAFT_900092 [Schizopora paradoxa]
MRVVNTQRVVESAPLAPLVWISGCGCATLLVPVVTVVQVARRPHGGPRPRVLASLSSSLSEQRTPSSPLILQTNIESCA